MCNSYRTPFGDISSEFGTTLSLATYCSLFEILCKMLEHYRVTGVGCKPQLSIMLYCYVTKFYMFRLSQGEITTPSKNCHIN